MSNLKDHYTESEWEDIEKDIKIKSDKGKPSSDFINLYLENKTLDELKKLRNVLKDIYNDLSLEKLNLWIKYKSNL